MAISPALFRIHAALLALASLLAACGHHGMVPTPAEQSQVQSIASSQSASEPFAATLRHHGFAHFLRDVDLTDQQQSQMRTLIMQFRQAHPPGSAFDLQALRTLHEQMFAVLTPAQQQQVQRNIEQWRSMPHGMWMRLNLTDQQRTQIRQLISQYRQAHPRGSPLDPQAKAALHQQLLNVLTPEQRTQLQEPQPAPSS